MYDNIGSSPFNVIKFVLVTMVMGIFFITIPAFYLLDGTYVVYRAVVVAAILGGALGSLIIAKHNVTLAIYMVILFFFGLPYYQLALMDSVPYGASWWRLLPVVLILPIMTLPYLQVAKRRPWFVVAGILWVIIHLPSIFQGKDVIDGGGLFFVAVLLPPLMLVMVDYLLCVSGDETLLLRVVFIGFCVTMVGSLLSLPFEMNYKQTTTILGVRELSRLNQVIGYLLLLWPLLMFVIMRSTWLVRALFWGLLAAVLICSYSRGGLIAVCVLVLLTFMKFRPQHILYLLGPIGIVYLIVANPLDLQFIHHWALRFNLYDLTGDNTPMEILEVLFRTPRLEIFEIAWNSAFQSNLLGIGLGQLSGAMQMATGSEWMFTGSHNMLLTILAERGLGPALFVIVIFIILFGVHFNNFLSRVPEQRRRGWLGLVSFSLFVIYAHTEGVELIHYTGRSVDAQTCFYLILNLVVALWGRSQLTSKT